MTDARQPTEDGFSGDSGQLPPTAFLQRIADCIDQASSPDGDNTAELLSCIKLLSQAGDASTGATNSSSELNPAVNDRRPDHPPPETFPLSFGPFELQSVLGSGGFGIVFRAFDSRLRRDVALKIPRPDLTNLRDTQQRLVREAQAAAVLDHPGIVPVFETGRVGLVWYIACGYSEGIPLDHWMRTHERPIPPRRAAELTAQLADALDHAHGRGVLHRDLKPSNILLLRSPSENRNTGADVCSQYGQPQIMDFGLAKRTDNEADTRTGTLLGTTHYMAPEQALGHVREISTQTDIYSLGVILYQLLTATLPFAGQSAGETRRLIEESSPRPLRALNPNVPVDLQTICLKCLEKLPNNRYQSAMDLAADLRRFLRNEPVTARPIGHATRAVRWCQRRPVLATLTGALVGAVVLGIIGIMSQWQRAERNLVEARRETQRADDNLRDVQRALIDLVWLFDEQSLWGSKDDLLNDAVRQKIRLYADSILGQRPKQGLPESLQAVLYTVSAKNNQLIGDLDAARENYHQSIQLWSAVLLEESPQLDQLRPLALTLYGYSTLAMQDSSIDDLESQTDLVRAIYAELQLSEENEVLVRRQFAELLVKLGIAQDRRRNTPQALNTLSLARAAWHELASRFPNARHLIGEATTLRELAWRRHRSTRQPRRAFTEFQEARQLAEQARQLSPHDTIVRFELARCWRNEAAFASQCGYKNAAINAYESGITCIEQLAKDDLHHLETRELHGELLHDFARYHFDHGDAQKAGHLYERCAAVWDELLTGGTLSNANRTQLAFAFYRAAAAQEREGRLPVALASYRRSLALFQQAVDERHPAGNVLTTMRKCCSDLARLLEQENQVGPAAEYRAQAAKIQTKLAKKRRPTEDVSRLPDDI